MAASYTVSSVCSCTSSDKFFLGGIRTNRFRESDPQYSRGVTLLLPDATDGKIQLTRAALAALSLIYRHGYAFQKAGVMLMDLRPKTKRQARLFDAPVSLVRRERVMATLDKLASKWGGEPCNSQLRPRSGLEDSSGQKVAELHHALG